MTSINTLIITISVYGLWTLPLGADERIQCHSARADQGRGNLCQSGICARSNITLAVKSFYPQPSPAALNHCTHIEGVLGLNIPTILVKIQQDKFYKPYQTIKTGSRFLAICFSLHLCSFQE